MAQEDDEPKIHSVTVRRWNDTTWWGRSKSADDLAPGFSFRLSPTVYVGDSNNLAQLRDEAFQRSVPLPTFAVREPLLPTAAEALGHEAELGAYYQSIMALTGKRKPSPGDVYYWLRFRFHAASLQEDIQFPWWDRVADVTPLLRWLRRDEEQREFFDADQGWMFQAAKQGARLHFRHSDLDTEEEFANVSVDRATFLARLDHAEAEVLTVISRLRNLVGVDPWS